MVSRFCKAITDNRYHGVMGGRVLTGNSLCSLWLVTMVIILLPASGNAQEQDKTNYVPATYLREAAENNPALRAQYRDYLASLEQVPQVGTLPDPELAFGYFASPIETRVGPQQARLGLTQMFPWFGTLGARSDAATEAARAKFEAFRELRNKLFYDIYDAWYRLYDIKQSTRITREHIDILETFEALALQRYENDQVSQADVLRVQIEKEDLKTRLALLEDNRAVALRQFNELLNRDPDTGVALPDSISPASLEHPVTEIERLMLSRNPDISRVEFEAASARSSIEAARKEGLPRFGIGLDYIITGERNMVLPDNGKDAMMARGAVQIPLFRDKYRAMERQAELRLQAVQDRQTATRNRLQTQFQEALRDYNDARRTIELYQTVQIQRTEQAIDILTEAYAAGSTDFEELLRLQRKLLDYELSRQHAIARQNRAVAFIQYLYGKHNVSRKAVGLHNE